MDSKYRHHYEVIQEVKYILMCESHFSAFLGFEFQ